MDDASFIRYLRSKRTVDDRALNRRVWDAMLSRAPAGARVLEIGGGIGTMIERVVDEGRMRPRSWTMVDANPSLVEEARGGVGRRAPFPLELVAASLDSFRRSGRAGFDLVIAHAFLDLVDVPRVLPGLLELAAPGGLFLFSINFDGLTILEPPVEPGLDQRIVELYHRTMDERVTDGLPSGDSRSGRHLLTGLPRAGFRILEAGSSDWIVLPRDDGYPADEEYFLECILSFFEESLEARPELRREELARWLSARWEQLAQHRLVFIAHQLDVLADSAGASR